MNLKLALQLFTNMGPRYTAYRVKHELEKKAGLLKKRHPANPQPRFFISLREWRTQESVFLVSERETFDPAARETNPALKEKAQRIINGETLFFSAEWKSLGKEYDWLTNPTTGHRYDGKVHWSEVADISQDAGDIKYVWERSRFSWLLTLIRDDYHNGTDHAEYVFTQIDDWIAHNPVNQGPNWRCSQESSLRITNWCYALHYYKNSEFLTEERWARIQNVIYWTLHHVYHHIDFSRIAVRNNHAVTETMFLSLGSILFPFIPETKKWSERGKKWFEEEVDYQIYDDGTFLQFSMNYHRVMIQLFSFGLALSEIDGERFSDKVYSKAYKSLDFLYQCLQEENGWLPNYGSNDGAWFFPLSDTDYRDYRPQLNTLSQILTGKPIYTESALAEDAFWTVHLLPQKAEYMAPLHKKLGTLSYPTGGFYLLRTPDHFTMIRCGNHKDRPAQADNLHLDVWVKGQNILRDSGTYQYNTSQELLDYFMGSASHNTVMVDGKSQMLKGSRFIWYYWSQAKSAQWKETPTHYVFEGEVSAFTYLNPKASHCRRVLISKTSPVWTVEDQLKELPEYSKKQLWHPADKNAVKFSAHDKDIMITPAYERSYVSDYYGQMEEAEAVSFTFREKIITKIELNTQ